MWSRQSKNLMRIPPPSKRKGLNYRPNSATCWVMGIFIFLFPPSFSWNSNSMHLPISTSLSLSHIKRLYFPFMFSCDSNLATRLQQKPHRELKKNKIGLKVHCCIWLRVTKFQFHLKLTLNLWVCWISWKDHK